MANINLSETGKVYKYLIKLVGILDSTDLNKTRKNVSLRDRITIDHQLCAQRASVRALSSRKIYINVTRTHQPRKKMCPLIEFEKFD